MVTPFLVLGAVELGPKAQRVDLVREGVAALDGAVEVVVQVVHVHVAVAKAAPRRDVEVAHHLVHADRTLDPAALLPLRVQPLAVALALALLDPLAAPERPAVLCVGLPHLIARVAAARLRRVGRRRRRVAGAAVFGVKMRCTVLRMEH